MFLRFLHRIFEIVLHGAARRADFAAALQLCCCANPWRGLLTALINLQRSRENVGLAEETPQPGEEEDVQTMIDEMRRHLVRDFPPGGFERAGNTKTHGLVRGELIIHDDLPDTFRHGLFATPKTYPCWVRFSGPGPHVEPDIDDVGFVSISVKVMGVEGEKLWDDEKHTQDFTAVCTPTFVTPDIKANARLQYWSRRHMPTWYFLNFTRAASARHADAGFVERNPDQSARRHVLQLRSLSDRAGPGDAIQLLAEDRGLPQDSAAAVTSARTIICATTWSARSTKWTSNSRCASSCRPTPF